MSSWLSTGPRLNTLSVQELYWRASTSGYCTNFQSYLIGFLYAKNKKRKFYIKDTTSNLESNYHLIQDTFTIPSFVIPTEKRGTSLFLDKIHDVNQYLLTLSNDTIRAAAKEAFQYKSVVLNTLQTLTASIPPIDVGLHIRMGDKITTGEMKEIALQNYIDELYKQKSHLQKTSLNVYIMTDNIEILHDIQRKIDTSISIFNLPLPFSLPGGHDQTTFNRQSPKLKQDAFYHFLAELYILQKSSRILCTFSSNVGRFLYMTCDNPSGVVSLDISEFTILQDMSIFLENAKRQSR